MGGRIYDNRIQRGDNIVGRFQNLASPHLTSFVEKISSLKAPFIIIFETEQIIKVVCSENDHHEFTAPENLFLLAGDEEKARNISYTDNSIGIAEYPLSIVCDKKGLVLKTQEKIDNVKEELKQALETQKAHELQAKLVTQKWRRIVGPLLLISSSQVEKNTEIKIKSRP